MKIRIADDDGLSRRLLEKTLEGAGYEVTVVANGREAVERLGEPEGPRLALLDWMMLELDGLGVCCQVRKAREQRCVYMVLLTSRESKEDIVVALESGADDYLVKLFNADELRAGLQTGERILHLEAMSLGLLLSVADRSQRTNACAEVSMIFPTLNPQEMAPSAWAAGAFCRRP